MNIESEIQLSLIISAIGAGAMTVSHTNDSYFWVVSRFGNMDIGQTLKGFTLATFWMGLSVLAAAIAGWLLFSM